jgi:hypothetical protein
MVFYQKYNPNKFKNIRQEYDGRRYDSKKEAGKAADLNLMLKGKLIKSWTSQWKIPFNVVYENGQAILTIKDGLELKAKGKDFDHLCNYYCDFKIEHLDGSIELLEIKSPITMTPVFKLKWKLLEFILKDDEKYFLTIET